MQTVSGIFNLVLSLRPLLQDMGLRRLMPRILIYIVLAIAAGILAGGILLGLFYALYLWLILQEFMPLHALLMTLATALLILVGAVAWLYKKNSRMLSKRPTTIERAENIVDAFLDGLRGR